MLLISGAVILVLTNIFPVLRLSLLTVASIEVLVTRKFPMVAVTLV